MTFEQILEGNERVSPEALWGENVSNRRNSWFKGPKVGESLVCQKNSKESSVAGPKQTAAADGLRGNKREPSSVQSCRPW